ncbi:MAG: response regulator [Pseudomonadota bacterium]
MQRKVLLIEDEPNIVEALSFLLTREGLDVRAHSNGDDAARVAQDTDPDLVILDVMLPNKSGFDILRELRAAPQTADLPVMMLTAKGQSKDRAEAEEAGANLFMTKPFSNAEIVAGVKRLLG